MLDRDRLLHQLTHGSLNDRRMALNELADCPSEDVVPLLQTLLDSPDFSLRKVAAMGFGNHQTHESFVALQSHDNWLLRQTILSVVAESGEEDLIWDLAVQALEDKHQTVKETGIFALGLLLSGALNTRAFEQLKQLAVDPVWRTRWRTAIALQHGPKEQVQPLLLQLKGDEHFRVVAAAMDVLNVI